MGGGLANADVIRGGRSMLKGEGGKICQNLADVICERYLRASLLVTTNQLVVSFQVNLTAKNW